MGDCGREGKDVQAGAVCSVLVIVINGHASKLCACFDSLSFPKGLLRVGERLHAMAYFDDVNCFFWKVVVLA